MPLDRAAHIIGEEQVSAFAAQGVVETCNSVLARVGLRRTAIYQRRRDGHFPRSRSLGPSCTVWVEAEIAAWVEAVASEP